MLLLLTFVSRLRNRTGDNFGCLGKILDFPKSSKIQNPKEVYQTELLPHYNWLKRSSNEMYSPPPLPTHEDLPQLYFLPIPLPNIVNLPLPPFLLPLHLPLPSTTPSSSPSLAVPDPHHDIAILPPQTTQPKPRNHHHHHLHHNPRPGAPDPPPRLPRILHLRDRVVRREEF